MNYLLNARFCAFSALLALLALMGCGSGSNSSDDDSTPQGTGNLTILIGDNPTDFDEIRMTVTEVRLLMEDGQEQFVLDTPQEIDLLDLANVTEVFLSEEIVAGTIVKIRLLVSEVRLVTLNDDGFVNQAESPYADLPPKIDLNPRGGIEVGVGDSVVMELDVDAHRSIHVVGAGNSGRYKFRPVVFVNVVAANSPSRLVRLFGSLVEDGVGGWELCALERLSQDDGGNNLDEADCIALDVENAMIAALSDSGEIDEDGILTANAPATAFGFVGFDGDIRFLDTVLVALGERGSFDTIHNFVIVDDSPVSVTLGDGVSVMLPAAEKIFDSAGNANAPTPVDSKVEAFGVMTGGEFEALLVSVRGPDSETMVSGAIDGAPANGRFTLNDAETTVVCPFPGEGAAYLDLTTAGDTTTTTPISFDLLMDMDTVDAYGAMVNGCFEASVVVRINE